MRVVLAQRNFHVGDIDANVEQVLAAAASAAEQGADLVVFPELCLTGYPPEDLLLRPSLNTRIEAALELLRDNLPVAAIVGYPAVRNGQRYNVAGLVRPGKLERPEYFKQCLPNYRVFDEKRYFVPGEQTLVTEISGCPVAISVCEDIWHEQPAERAVEAGARLIINLNASPFRRDKHAERVDVVRQRARTTATPVLYCNLVGGQDELVFDGGSFALDGRGQLVAQAPFFEEALLAVDVDATGEAVSLSGAMASEPLAEAAIYQALVLAVRDYVGKNGFRGALLGLSGGIDSALTLAIAVDALGADRVQAIMMPFTYTSSMSLEDAEAEARTLGVDYRIWPIAHAVEGFMQILAEPFAGLAADTTEENLQARTRGTLLMAMSNKKGSVVLTTGNKSEMAVGYATLYGDMAGGFSVLKDVSKTWVYRLSRYRNQIAGHDVIPQRVIDRPPSAELAPDQVDQDSLPDYDILDQILELYVEQDCSAEAVIRAGFEREEVYRVVKMVDRNEYKRRQAAVGPRVTRRAFGKDRRYPITNGWRAGD
ncbi:MAG: NAD+ synthase [Alcanivoracaceae bacterium]|nr:NAD+ synthase [Alcanivoracaceae bacterium]